MSYYGYVERENASQINWAEVGENLTGVLKKASDDRQAKRNAFDQSTKDFQETLNNSPSGDFKTANAFALNHAADASKTRLIHISTDCVFSGEKGNYLETDQSDAKDLYGKTKFLGELTSYKNSITLRSSIIGPELKGRLSLLEWFLNTKESVNGFTNAIYSGFTTLELTNIIENYVIPNPNISGLFNVSSDSISKYDLLEIIAKVYKKNVSIKPFDKFKNDKSLNSDLFKKTFAFTPKSWEEMIVEMYTSKVETNTKFSL